MALLGLAAAAEAGDIPNDSQWSGGGGDETITVGVTDDPATAGGSVFYSVSDSTGGSAAVPGDMGANGSDLHPTVSTGEETSTTGGNHYRANGGKMQRKARDGQWKDMKLKKKHTRKGGHSDHLQAGQPAPHDGWLFSPTHRTIRLFKAQAAPWSGWLTGGEEITSLPE